MNFADCIKTHSSILMEGALGERLKREYQFTFHEQVAMAPLIYEKAVGFSNDFRLYPCKNKKYKKSLDHYLTSPFMIGI